MLAVSSVGLTMQTDYLHAPTTDRYTDKHALLLCALPTMFTFCLTTSSTILWRLTYAFPL